MRNPLARSKSPLDQAIEIAKDVRSEAAGIAGTVRDAAAKTADVLGESDPRKGGSRLPIVGAAAAAVAGVAYAVRSRASGGAATVAPEQPKDPRANTAESAAAGG